MEAESKGWGAEPGGVGGGGRGTGNVIALSYCGASLPGLTLPLRKFLQTKIYTDTTVSTVPPSSPVASSPSRLLSLFCSPWRACETASSKREAMSTAHFNIPRFHKNMTFLENLETRIHYEPLDLRRKSTSITTDPMRLPVDTCLLSNKESALVIFAS